MSLDELTSGTSHTPLPQAEYERRIAKLAKINAALMQRVERSMEQQANAFSLFQAAIGLEAQVRLRTDELKHALDRLAETNEELVSARDASNRANRVKTRFFTAVGHDLLQPLHAARLSLSALTGPATDGASGPVAAGNGRLLAQIDHALVTVEELLKTVLDLSKLESGVLTPTLDKLPLQTLFDSLTADIGPIARDKGLLLTVRRTDALVESDALMLRRMLQNLLANAVRYTEHGEIKLAARRRGRFMRIEVWDTGPGIAPEERSRIFEEFQRGAASDRAGVSGFGLGLSIVQRMAETLGHHIDLCSREGRGTRFSILAPFAGKRAHLAPTPYSSAPTTAAETVSLAGTRIVVVDNDMAILTAMDALLESWGCNHRLARHVEEMDEILADPCYRPDVVLADYHLDHGETGLDAIARVRRTVGSPTLPAIVITADHSGETEAAIRAAHCEVMLKPVRPAELRALVQHLLLGASVAHAATAPCG